MRIGWPVAMAAFACCAPSGHCSPAVFELINGPAPDFVARQGNTEIVFRSAEMVILHRGTETLRMRWSEANSAARLNGIEPAEGIRNYLVSPAPAGWRTGVRTYQRIRVARLYRGIDLVYYFIGDRLRWDLLVAPGADAGAIRLDLAGGNPPRLTSDGTLQLQTGAGVIHLGRPSLYQVGKSGKMPVSGGYRLPADRKVAFEIADYDRARELIIDPEVVFSGTLGGSEKDLARAVAVDRQGNAYVAGETSSPDFPAVDVTGTGRHGSQTHVFVAKFPAAGGKPVYSTYIAGNGSERAYGIAVDELGSVYIAGDTSSGDFPVTSGAAQRHKAGDWDGFVLKLDPTGSKVVYGTYVGGNQENHIRAIAVDRSGTAFVGGYTNSPDFATTPGAVRRKTARYDAFAVSLTAGGALAYSTLLGGRFDEYAFGIATDGSGGTYVVGQTNSPDFPVTAGSFRPTKAGFWDAFVTKIGAGGKVLSYSTFLGGTRDSQGRGTTYGTAIAVGRDGSAYVTGYTDAINFPTSPGAMQARPAGRQDGFVTKLDPKGSAVLYSTYLGGSADDVARAIAVDSEGYAYVAGRTVSRDFPGLSAGAVPDLPGAFFVRLDPAGSRLFHLAPPGANYEDAYGIAIDGPGSAWAVGQSTGKGKDAYVLRLSTR